MATYTGRFKLAQNTAAGWTSAGTVLLLGEIGYETDTGKAKVGDGSTAWASLPYDNQFTGTLLSKLNAIEASADVTDETNVTAALDGATLTAVSATLTDKVLILDASDSDNLKTVTPQTIIDLITNTVYIGVACSDETTALTTGTAKVTFRMPLAITLTDVRASVTTAPTGATITVDINESATTILSTKLTIDATEKTSETAATPAVISDAALADDAEITIDIDQVGSTIAGAGLKVWMIGTF